MKKLITNFKVLMLVALTIGAASCTDDDDNGGVLDNNNSAYDLTVDNADFTILNAALLRTGLDATLDQAGGTFTVFAPTDTAFQTFLSANGFATIDDVPVLILRNTLRNHVLGTVARSTDLTDGYVKTSATNGDGDALDLYVDLTAGVVLNGGAEVTMADVSVDNGVVHVVDEVIALPTVVTLAAANPSFSNLVTAVDQEGLVPTLSDDTATFTVFAPTNDAFQALIDESTTDGLNNISDVLALSNLTDVLTYHVVSGAAVRAENIVDGANVDPIGPGTFSITGTVITDAQTRDTNIIVTNITSINGVVHAIDNVLLP
ncbi:fasciclin domain-containing protein [Nonlabens ulvanivorans]|uniref:fasciclin domain-containing protein n=1 Tax=Nonlabens ulvanivorans TaxID=906888 RepID=UPI003262D002